MSAPIEVFVQFAPFDDDTVVGWACDRNDPDRETPRYLRADLTCGECRRLEIRHSDFFGNVHLCVGRIPMMELRKESDPACMAFTPKEKP